VTRVGGVDYFGPVLFPSATEYLNHQSIFEENPDTLAPWTKGDVNGAEFGYEVTT
jgi:hypothetical protein